MRRPWRLLMLWTSVLSACVGTNTGNPVQTPQDGNETGSGACDQTTTQLDDLNAQSPLGFSAADMLALAQAKTQTSIAWQSADDTTLTPESGTGTLMIDIQPRAGGAPRFVDRRPKGSSGGAEIELGSAASACSDTVELDVSAHVYTAGGALDEHIDTTLSARSAAVARMSASRTASEVEGKLDAQIMGEPMLHFDRLSFEFAFSRLGPSGSLEMDFTQQLPTDPSSGSTASSSVAGIVARWPAGASCVNDPISGTGFPAAIDQAVDQFSMQDGIDRFNAASLQLSASGSAETALSARFTPQGGACAVLEPSQFGPAQALPMISVSGRLALRSADGRIDGDWPMQLRASAASDGSLGQVELAYDLHGSMIASLVDASAFEATYGVHGFDLSGYDQAGVMLNVTVGPDAAVSGELVVNGVNKPTCQAPTAGRVPGSADSAPACAGLQFSELWTAAITAGN